VPTLFLFKGTLSSIYSLYFGYSQATTSHQTPYWYLIIWIHLPKSIFPDRFISICKLEGHWKWACLSLPHRKMSSQVHDPHGKHILGNQQMPWIKFMDYEEPTGGGELLKLN
jgi:hypothetical protein